MINGRTELSTNPLTFRIDVRASRCAGMQMDEQTGEWVDRWVGEAAGAGVPVGRRVGQQAGRFVF